MKLLNWYQETLGAERSKSARLQAGLAESQRQAEILCDRLVADAKQTLIERNALLKCQERERSARQALDECGMHGTDCPSTWDDDLSRWIDCDCGLSAALNPEVKK